MCENFAHWILFKRLFERRFLMNGFYSNKRRDLPFLLWDLSPLMRRLSKALNAFQISSTKI